MPEPDPLSELEAPDPEPGFASGPVCPLEELEPQPGAVPTTTKAAAPVSVKHENVRELFMGKTSQSITTRVDRGKGARCAPHHSE